MVDGVIFAGDEPLLETGELRLIGAHNADNAMAAAAAALAMGIDREAVREGLRTFAGVPHRLERVAEVDGSRSSTIRRPPTSPRRRQRCARSTAACGRSSAAR